MNNLIQTYEIRWADVDANQHLRHTAYSDYACHARVALFTGFGLSYPELERMGIGPILFREETLYHSEVKLCEKIKVTSELTEISMDGKKWKFKQYILKMDGSVAGVVSTEGAILDLKIRKISIPPAEVYYKLKMLKFELDKLVQSYIETGNGNMERHNLH